MRHSLRLGKQLCILVIGCLAFFSGSPGLAQDPPGLRIGLVLPVERADTGADTAIVNALSRAARSGATMAADEFGFNAQLLGRELEVFIVEAEDGPAARDAARRLIDEEAVVGLAGGFGLDQALALSALAQARRIPFLNLGAPSDRLRNEACNRFTFHVEPSAAMYLDALAGWFIRSEFRRWFFVYSNDAEGRARYERMNWSLKNRHFGAREVGKRALAAEAQTYEDLFRSIERARPDVVLMLLGPRQQLDFLAAYEAAGLEPTITGFPDPLTQTRTFFAAARDAAPRTGAGFRATAWEASLDAYGARELNQRYADRTGTPMEPAAWAAYQAVKIFFEGAFLANARDGAELTAYFEHPQTVIDAWKGIGLSFRPWDHQLRQPLYLVSIRETASAPEDLALLVGELPAIYMPRTDPVERLDQLGDLERESRCSF